MEEPEAEEFERVIAWQKAVVGTPTLFEARLVLTDKMRAGGDAFLDSFIDPADVRAIDFTIEMYRSAVIAFDLFGKGRRHPAKLNFGDCIAYAVAKVHDVPLLYKGDDF